MSANTICLDSEEKYCKKLFRETYRRQPDGKFVVKLSVREEMLTMLNFSKEIALKKFLALERKFTKNPEFKAKYVKFMREYLRLGHMRHKLKTKKADT